MENTQYYRILSFLGVLLMLIPGSGAGASRLGNTLEVLPRPLEFAASDSSFTVAAGTALVLYGTTGGGDRFAAGEFNAWLDELGYRALDVKIAGDFEDLPTAAGSILVGAPEAGSRMEGFLSEAGVEIDPPLKDEEYLIVVRASGAAVAARTAAGRFYGLMTLAQMFRKKVDTTLLPGGVLRDKPALALRGISDDISRGQVSTLDDLKAVVRFLARYKINVYMPYMEDMFAFRSHPGFGDGRGALTAAEVKELEDFARPLHVRIIPIFQTLGHYENLLLEPEYRHLAEFPGAHCLSPAQEETYTFLGEVLGEIVPAFSDRYFHIACDESWDVGRGKSRELVRKLGTSGAHAAHYRKVYDMVTGMDRRVMMYGDIILRNPSIMSKIPRDIVIVDWHYSGAKYPSVKKFRDAGFDVVVSPGLSNWSRVYPAFNSAMSNIERLTREGIDKGALGAVTSSWCDYGAANLRQNNLWGYAFAAQCAWSPGKANRREVERIFWKNFFGVEKAGSFVRLNGLLVASAARGSTVNDLWRHPLMGASKRGGAGPSPVKRGEDILKKMEKAREILASAQTTVRANRDYLDLLLFNVEMAELLGRKYIWMGSYKRDRKASLPPEKAASLAADAGEMVRTYGAVRKRFEDIWLKYNRPEGLENNLRLFDRQLVAWKKIEQALNEGRHPDRAEIPSVWITPGRSAAIRKTNSPRSAYFRSEFNLEAMAGLDAKLQLLGTSHVEVWLNGEKVGEKIGRHSLSTIVENECARPVDITRALKPGRNVLAAKVTNYEGKIPALNLYGEIYEGGSRSQRILTDPEYWRGIETKQEPRGFVDDGFDESSWKRCTKYKFKFPVSAPVFEAGLSARVER